MKPNDTLRKDISQLERDLFDKKRELDHIERNCSHDWKVREEMEDYQREIVNYNNPTIQGVHIYYHPSYVPARRKVWIRECSRCGKTEKTHETKESVSHVPNF